MESSLSPSEQKDLRDVISIYGSPSTQTIPTNMLGPALRAMKLNPQEKELIKYITEHDRGGSGTLSRSQLITIYLNKKQEPDTLDQLLQAFSYLDKEKSGSLKTPEFKYYMSKLGETMNEVDVEDVLKTTECDLQGKIPIEKFSKALLGLK
jgi:Ca2+-binding EF-hand superfamily protein